MDLAQPGAGDTDEVRALLHLRDGAAARIAHARAQATEELQDDLRDGAAVRHPALDTLGYELFVCRARLAVAVLAAAAHGAERAHAAIALVATALIQDQVPGRL